MPLEIKELHIKAVIDNGKSSSSGKPDPAPVDVKEIVAECVHQVMEILKEKQDR